MVELGSVIMKCTSMWVQEINGVSRTLSGGLPIFAEVVSLDFLFSLRVPIAVDCGHCFSRLDLLCFGFCGTGSWARFQFGNRSDDLIFPVKPCNFLVRDEKKHSYRCYFQIDMEVPNPVIFSVTPH